MPRQIDRAYLETIPDDEPVFILRAQDALAVPRIQEWITAADQAGVPLSKITNAIDQHRDPFLVWQAANPSKVKLPD